MTQTLELTAAELTLIENARKQEVLAKEAKALQDAARLEKEIIENEKYILKEQVDNNAQVAAASNFVNELKKLNPNYKLIVEERELNRYIKGEYLPDTKNYEREILKEFKYTLTQAHITLDGTPFKIEVKKHMVYGDSWRGSITDNGYKMKLCGGGYSERLLSNPKTLNKKIEDKLQAELNAKVAEQKKASSLDTAYNNLVNKYPEATICKSTEWERNRFSYDKRASGETINIITVTLLNKIEIKFKVYSDGTLGRKEISYPFKNNFDLLDTLNNIIIPEVTN
jgi:hypothetical protein